MSSSPQRLVEKEEEEKEPSIRHLPQAGPFPRRLAVGRGVGGAAVTEELVEVRGREKVTVCFQGDGLQVCACRV